MKYKTHGKTRTKMLACFSAALFSFYDVFELALFNRLNPHIQGQFHISAQTVGALSSSYLWANAIGLIPVGVLLDRGYTRQTAYTLLSLAVASNLVFMYSHNLPLAFIARSVQGLASAGSLLTCMRMGINWYKEKANAAIGWMIAVALSGGLVANFITSWTVAFWLGAGILIIVFCFLYDTPSQTHLQQSHKFSLNFKNILMGGYLGSINFPVFILGSLWGNIFLAYHTELTLVQRSFVSSLIFAGIIVGSPLWGMMANRMNPKKILIGGCLALIFLCVLLNQIHPHFLIISFIFFSFGFFSCTQNMAYYVLSNINTPASLSRGTAIASVIFNLIGAISQIVFYIAPQLLLYPLIALLFLLLSLI